MVGGDPFKTALLKEFKMKTLADLKRDSKSGKLYGVMTVRCGSNEIPERLAAKRQIMDANSVAIFFKMADGKKSELRIDRASLLEYAEDTLTIYNEGFRDLNNDEKAIMQEWKEIENKPENIKQLEIDMLSDGSTMFYKKKVFFHNKGYSYLTGFDEEKGLKYDFNTQKIRDKNIKGSISMQYKLIRE